MTYINNKKNNLRSSVKKLRSLDFDLSERRAFIERYNSRKLVAETLIATSTLSSILGLSLSGVIESVHKYAFLTLAPLFSLGTYLDIVNVKELRLLNRVSKKQSNEEKEFGKDDFLREIRGENSWLYKLLNK